MKQGVEKRTISMIPSARQQQLSWNFSGFGEAVPPSFLLKGYKFVSVKAALK
jgi:hypothetical protein